jgi:hypothetical protein
LANFFGRAHHGFTNIDFRRQALHKRGMFFGYVLLTFLTVVAGNIQVFLLEPLGDEIQWQPFNLDGKGSEGVAKQMGFENHWCAFACLKTHPMQQKTEASANGNIIQMLLVILKDVRHLLFKTMGSRVPWGKLDAWEWFSWLEVVMVTEQMPGLLNELEPISANAVMMAFVSPFPFGQQPKDIANTWGLICGTRRRIINEPNEALWQETHLHQLIYPHASRGQQFQGEQAKGSCRIERFHRDEGSTTACLCLLRDSSH